MAAAAAGAVPSLRAAKSGLGRIAATAVAKDTSLTEVAHRSPTRLIPMPSTSVSRAGAALVAVSSYGGGMVRGDRQDLSIKVDEGAKLGLVTQGATRIYRRAGRLGHGQAAEDAHQLHEPSCRSDLRAKVGRDAVLVVAPDPLVPFSRSSFVQRQRFDLDPDASLLLVDWFGAGRVNSGERWDFDLLSSRCDLFHANACGDTGGPDTPFLIESLSMDNRRRIRQDMPNSSFGNNVDPFCFDVSADATFDAFASVIIHGPAMEEVSARFEELSRSLASEHTRIRDVGWHHLDESATQQLVRRDLHLGGRVLLGFSKVEPYGRAGCGSDGSTRVARIAGTSNEDLYRVLNSCLHPLRDGFGFEFYRDRINSSTSHRKIIHVNGPAANKAQPRKCLENQNDVAPMPLHGRASWCALMLADSGLPTGSFAHSASIESAAQLGLFGGPSNADKERVARYINAAARSSVQLLVPYAIAGNVLARTHHTTSNGSAIDMNETFQQWQALDRIAHAALAANRPGCKASLDQGHGMIRVAMQWIGSDAGAGVNEMENSSMFVKLAHRIQEEMDRSSDSTGHFGPIFGLVCGFLELDSKAMCRVLGYCTARDMISAAVRLNLVGPMAGVNLLDGAYKAVEEGIESGSFKIEENHDVVSLAMETVATCSPVVEAVHPTHDVLAVRLFRT
jgi:urease accessory protein UreH/urease accessory protein UreF